LWTRSNLEAALETPLGARWMRCVSAAALYGPGRGVIESALTRKPKAGVMCALLIGLSVEGRTYWPCLGLKPEVWLRLARTFGYFADLVQGCHCGLPRSRGEEIEPSRYDEHIAEEENMRI